MSDVGRPIIANPRPRTRPARYAIAFVIAAVLVLVLIANSLLDYAFLDSIAGRTSLFGLLAVALISLATFIAVRVVDRDPAQRRRHAIRAAVLLGLATLLWLSVALQFTVVGPNPNVEPDDGEQLAVTDPSTRSEAEAE